jgi:hypothetical protein
MGLVAMKMGAMFATIALRPNIAAFCRREASLCEVWVVDAVAAGVPDWAS